MTMRFSSSAGRRLRALATLALVLALVAACGGGGPPTGVVSGQLRVGASGASAGGATTLQPIPWRAPDADASVDRALAAAALADRPFVPGEIVVAFEPSLRAAAVDRLSVAGVTLEAVRTLATGGAALYRTTAATLDEALAVAAALEARPDVRYAHPNYLLFPARAPNDPSYAQQWHYRAIDLESAWDVSVGSSDVVVAVLDTGIYYSQADPSKRHPDLVGRVLPGYDFISNATYARDGDGRDPDPFDTVPGNDYHGTHVAGTIGAATDNGVGVAGVDWHARLLPLRVLGDGGGSVADVADAIVWAVGGSVPGVSTNANPARVVNLSLGGAADECYGALADAIARALQSAVVVAAAGNVNQPAIGFTPANCPGAIVVGATDRDGDRASYSNYGSRIDIMAPGGDAGSAQDGVLSTGPGGYAYMYGTSMAAPHVSGVVSLMLAADDGLDSVAVLEYLRASATPMSHVQCRGQGGTDRVLYSSDCGAGLLDAGRALALLGGDEPDPGPVEGVALTFSPPVLDLGAAADSATFTVTNVGDETADWELVGYFDSGSELDNPGPVPTGAIEAEIVGEPDPDGSTLGGTLDPGESVTLRLYVNREFLEAEGYYGIEPVFAAGGQDFFYLVRFANLSTAPAQLGGAMVVLALKEGAGGGYEISGSQSRSQPFSSFEFEAEAGPNLLSAWSDENRNGQIDGGDFVGAYPSWDRQEWVEVPAGGRLTGLDILLQPHVQSGGLPDGVLEALEAAGGGAR